MTTEQKLDYLYQYLDRLNAAYHTATMSDNAAWRLIVMENIKRCMNEINMLIDFKSTHGRVE